MRFGSEKQHPTEAERKGRLARQANDAVKALEADSSLTDETRQVAMRVIDHFRGLHINVKEKENTALEAVRTQLVQECGGSQLSYPVRHGLEISYELLRQAKAPRRNAGNT